MLNKCLWNTDFGKGTTRGKHPSWNNNSIHVWDLSKCSAWEDRETRGSSLMTVQNDAFWLDWDRKSIAREDKPIYNLTLGYVIT